MPTSIWISKFVIDLIDCTVRLEATRDPDRGMHAFEVEFRDVGNVQVDRYHDADEPSLGNLMGIGVEQLAHARARFRADTGDAVVVFEAAASPKVTPLGDSKVSGSDIFITTNRTSA